MKQRVQRKRPNIVSVQLSPEGKQQLDDVCEKRGMTIKTLLGRLILWFVKLDKTEQSMVLGQIEETDVEKVGALILRRRGRAAGEGVVSAASLTAGQRARRQKSTG